MRNLLTKGLVAGFAALAVAGCVDDKYDLSDIDTTVRVSVNDLEIPINLDVIKLESVIDTTDEIKVVDGAYAYVTNGTFDSDAIHIDPVEVDKQTVDPANFKIAYIGNLPGMDGIQLEITETTPSTFNYTAENVSKNIQALYALRANTSLTANLNLTALAPVANNVDIEDFKVQLPKGLVNAVSTPKGTYDAASGVLTLDKFTAGTSAATPLTVNFEGITLSDDALNSETHTFTFTGALSFLGGKFSILNSYFQPGQNYVQDANITVTYVIPGFTVYSVDGLFQYDVEGLDIDPIALDDLPDFLDQPGTNLVLKNPQIYLHLNNPMQSVGLYAQTGFKITALRDNQAPVEITTDEPTFEIGAAGQLQSNGAYNYCLAPARPANPDAGYPNINFVGFKQLSGVLSGDGLPKEIRVDLDGAMIPSQRVNDFRLGDYPEVKGSYKLIAPFELGDKSCIVYADTVDGWNDSGDLDKLTVQKVEVSFTLTTDLPVSVSISGYPIDINGKQIDDVEIKGAHFTAGAQSQEVTISATGDIKSLDGIIFRAEATSDGTGSALGPDLNIRLTNLRPKVSGYYQDEL